MTEQRAYPREWFGVSSAYDREPEAKMFLRETDKVLFYEGWNGKEQREFKAGGYRIWYSTREEAEAALCRKREAADARVAASRIERAAPELYEALTSLLTAVEYIDALKGDKGEDVRATAHAALAKARGE